VPAKYLLPCPCGQQIVIERRHAGQTVPCSSCGAMVQVPTLLAMAELEPAPAESAIATPRSTWGLKQQLRLVGIVVVLAAVVGGVWLFCHQPRSRFDSIDPERVRQVAQSLPPARTWDIWETMKQGLDRRIDQQYAAAVLQFRTWEVAAAAATLLGVALIVASMVGNAKQGLVRKDS
jgi:hypothetical protein